MITNKNLRLAVEKEDERRMLHRRKKKRKTREDGSYHTALLGLGDRGRKKSKKWIGFDLDLIWIENGVLKIQGMSPLAL